ncbi:MAG: PHP domain-containing protein [Bacteroidales bacterium]
MRSDLHIHTTLSPCGDIEMTPKAIVEKAIQEELDLIAITDHNSTLQSSIIQEVGEREGVRVLCGAELCSKEEVHVVAIVEERSSLTLLQNFIERRLMKVKNREEFFGYQLVVNEQEEVLHQEEWLLINALESGVDEIIEFIHSIGGVAIAAHIDRGSNSLLSQLGYIPPDLAFDAFELSYKCQFDQFLEQNRQLHGRALLCSSDAHYIEDIGRCYTLLDIENWSFETFRNAIKMGGSERLRRSLSYKF